MQTEYQNGVIKPKTFRPSPVTCDHAASVNSSPKLPSVFKRLSVDLTPLNDNSTIDDLSESYMKYVIEVHRELSEPLRVAKWCAPIERPEAPVLDYFSDSIQ
jgi:hypothetical protein